MRAPTRQVEIVEDVAAAGARHLLHAVAAGGHIAFAGGEAAMATYRAVRTMGVGDWSRATVWFSDERAVDLDDSQSNAGQALAALLDDVDARSVEVMRTKLSPAAAATEYEARIRAAVPVGSGATPRFDLVLLGMGPDGHTASLPPHGDVLAERERLVAHVDRPSLPPDVPRITFTLPLIDAAARVLFLVPGRELAEAARRAFSQPPSAAVPASLVHPSRGHIHVLVDSAAATGLDV